ncbi:M56 family metallopeptidase [Clostridium coskatii]|uniref:Regulatory protein BlaR1 n=1 Tax=Clostridium coskatii TaxID=1705578 RepID=A0A166U1A6_9CLOT|nr:M56 family metallopeptidase [Clostridium coskatii]OAA94437.1 Regulatory protein BlaR1 [Clostridium coskatii]OBR93181.1 regulatory protein BlaR1 [Clostridium coskatii]
MFKFIILYKWVLYLSLLASFLIIFFLAAKKVLKQRLRIEVQYIIGILILVRLIVPALPKSSLSIFNIMPFYFNRPPVTSAIDKFDYDQYLTESVSEKSVGSAKGETDYAYLNPSIIRDTFNIPESYMQVTFEIWYVGFILGMIYMLMSYVTCLKKVSKYESIRDKRIIDILKKCKNNMNIKKNINVVQGIDIKSPAIFGMIAPKILMPLTVIKCMNDNDIKNIFLHELSHYKKKDIFVNYVIGITRVIYWFNPIIWYFTNEMKKDMELSCDSIALNYIESEKTKEYGYTMIDLIKYSKFVKKSRVSMAVGISVDAKYMAKRISMIKKFERISPKAIVSSIIVFCFCILIMLTEAKINNVFSQDALNKQITSKYVVDELGINRIEDNTSYPYECDLEVLGNWKSVDIVDNISDFKKDKRQWKDNMYIKEIKFFNGGATDKSWLTWTKGIVIDKSDKLSSEYVIKNIDGEIYMFFRWKNGDYAFGCRKPVYYVLKKV